MYWEWIKYAVLSLLLLPTMVLAQAAQDTGLVDQGADGAGAAAGWWWFWVILLLAVVGIAIWWAARAGTQGGSRPRGGAGAQRV